MSDPNGPWRGRLLILAAALLWSTSGLFLKAPILNEGLSAGSRGPILACYRALFAALLLAPFVPARAVRWRRGLLPLVASFAVMNLLFVTAMTRTTAAAAIFLQYTSAVWAFAFGYFVLKEPVDRASLVAVACAVAGIGWIVAADWSGDHAPGNAIALGSGLCYAGVVLSLRALRVENPAWLIALCHAASFLALWPWVVRFDDGLQGLQWVVVALLGMMQMGLPYVLFARGVRTVRAQEAALLGLCEPVLNPLWVWLAWGERPNPATLAGGSLILAGLAASILLPRSPAPSQPAHSE